MKIENIFIRDSVRWQTN